MALLIDTLAQNKSVFNPNPELNSSNSYGIWDLTRASITYDKLNIKLKSFFTVTEYYQMRPDLIATIKLGEQGKMGSLLKFNGVSNPFALAEGIVLAIPDPSTVKESFRVKKDKNQAAASSNTNTNPNNAFKKNQEQKKFKVSDGRKKFLEDKIKNKPELNLPPNVLQPGEKVIDKKNGFFIFAPDAGGGGFNLPQSL
jgi:hypothetical protein